MSDIERAAWSLYCAETAGDMDVRDFWIDLSQSMREHYISKAMSTTV